MDRFLVLINQLQESLKHKDLLNTSISKNSVLWHIEHSTLSIQGIYERLKTSNPSDYKSKFSLVWFIVKWSKNIPRGKAKSPASVVPKENIDLEKLTIRLSNLSNILIDLENLPELSFIEHPVFNTLKKEEAFKFLYIHTIHHYKIIQDIIKN